MKSFLAAVLVASFFVYSDQSTSTTVSSTPDSSASTSSSNTSPSSTSDTTTPTSSKPSSTSKTTIGTTTATMPFSGNCQSFYENCTMESSYQSLAKEKEYCDAFNRSCNIGQSSCTKAEIQRLLSLHCGPAKLFTELSECWGPMITCLFNASGVLTSLSSYTNTFFCNAAKEHCLTTTGNCSKPDYELARKTAQCSSAALIFNVLVVIMAFFTQKVLK